MSLVMTQMTVQKAVERPTTEMVVQGAVLRKRVPVDRATLAEALLGAAPALQAAPRGRATAAMEVPWLKERSSPM
jgi:hypothetical protein